MCWMSWWSTFDMWVYGKTCGQLNGKSVTEGLDSMYSSSPLYFPIKPLSLAHMWLNLPRYWQVALWSGIGRSPHYFLWLFTPWSHKLLPLEPSVCLGNCVWQAKEQAIYVKCEGGSIPFPSDSCHLIWYRCTAKLGGVRRGLDLLVFVLCNIAVVTAASGRCLVHYCICFCGVCSVCCEQ